MPRTNPVFIKVDPEFRKWLNSLVKQFKLRGQKITVPKLTKILPNHVKLPRGKELKCELKRANGKLL